jgi:hypothetical protein
MKNSSPRQPEPSGPQSAIDFSFRRSIMVHLIAFSLGEELPPCRRQSPHEYTSA